MRRVLGSPGRPPASSARQALEPRLGRTLGEIRIHSDHQAAESARAIDARGYSYGNDIVVDAAMGADRLGQVLMHELIHTTQVADPPRTFDADVPMSLAHDDAFEHEARAAGSSTGTSCRGPAILRRDAKDAPTTDPQVGPPALDMPEELLVWQWLSRWEVEHPERTLLRNRLGANHATNIHRIAREIWLRRLASRGRVDPTILLGGEEAETDELRSLQSGPVKELYERAIYIQEQQLSQAEQDEVEIQVAAVGLKGRGPASPLTGDPKVDTTVLTRSILCRRIAFIVRAPLDPLFCIDDPSTEANPLKSFGDAPGRRWSPRCRRDGWAPDVRSPARSARSPKPVPFASGAAPWSRLLACSRCWRPLPARRFRAHAAIRISRSRASHAKLPGPTGPRRPGDSRWGAPSTSRGSLASDSTSASPPKPSQGSPPLCARSPRGATSSACRDRQGKIQ